MNTVPRIVVGVDGFESSTAALRWAIHQAKLTGAVVDAVTTWHIPLGSGLVPAVDMPDYQDDARIILTEAITEIRDVALARGIQLAADVVPRTLAWIDQLPADGTTSLQRDLIAGRPSELDAWTGAVVRLGNAAGVPTPVNTFLYDLATARALAARN